MLWRAVALVSLSFAVYAVDAPKAKSVRGILVQSENSPPAIRTTSGPEIELSGDKDTMGVLRDHRLAGFDLEAKGHFTDATHFQVDPIHTKAMFVHKDGHMKVITYWCDVCSIRTYTPGICWCCQQETTLDLRDPNQK